MTARTRAVMTRAAGGGLGMAVGMMVVSLLAPGWERGHVLGIIIGAAAAYVLMQGWRRREFMH